ncbi:MAG TPA: ribosome silencing factor [Lentisphaeria bacterium]|nr:MAG: ribosome silencing factor [Lentisphaerae bacterium GWF2_49_21]HBC87367.1 ribosome silencing factor [Lentisphaeria bacterium]
MAKKAVKKTAKKTVKTVVSGKAEELAYICAKTADDHKAENVITLKLSGLSVIADYFVLCTGNSIPHISAITDSVTREVRAKMDKRPRAIDGVPASLWTVIDFGSVIVHVLSPKMREQYKLESLWGDAPKIETLKLLAKKSLS